MDWFLNLLLGTIVLWLLKLLWNVVRFLLSVWRATPAKRLILKMGFHAALLEAITPLIKEGVIKRRTLEKIRKWEKRRYEQLQQEEARVREAS